MFIVVSEGQKGNYILKKRMHDSYGVNCGPQKICLSVNPSTQLKMELYWMGHYRFIKLGCGHTGVG